VKWWKKKSKPPSEFQDILDYVAYHVRKFETFPPLPSGYYYEITSWDGKGDLVVAIRNDSGERI
jgi:hypothetical protein